jgi:hypothetical protein
VRTGNLCERGGSTKAENARLPEGSTEASEAACRVFEPHSRMQAVSKSLLLVSKSSFVSFDVLATFLESTASGRLDRLQPVSRSSIPQTLMLRPQFRCFFLSFILCFRIFPEAEYQQPIMPGRIADFKKRMGGMMALANSETSQKRGN